MAQVLANAIFLEQGLLLEAISCGVFAMEDMPASAYAADVVYAEYGLDLSGHKSKPVQAQDVEQAAVVIAMTNSHKTHLLGAYPQFSHKISLLFDGDINDPFGGNLEIYKKCAMQIKTHLEKTEWGQYL
jgi:protein-tyrosine-phosphatase